VCGPGFNHVGKSEHEITESYDSIGTNDSVGRLLKDREQQRKMLLTELRTTSTTAAGCGS